VRWGGEGGGELEGVLAGLCVLGGCAAAHSRERLRSAQRENQTPTPPHNTVIDPPFTQVPQMLHALLALLSPLEAMQAALRLPEVTGRFVGVVFESIVFPTHKDFV